MSAAPSPFPGREITKMSSEKTIPNTHPHSLEEEEDDDPPMLSSQAIEALRELLTEQNRTIDTDTGATAVDDVALLTEDWRMSQFWYDRETAETVAREVHALCSSIQSPSVACLACPTLYVYLKVIFNYFTHIHAQLTS